jgi:hypothetical protein
MSASKKLSTARTSPSQSFPKGNNIAVDSIISKVEHVKGSIAFRCQGFLKAKNNALSLFSPADTFSLELDMCPDGSRQSSSQASLSMVGNSIEIESLLEWKFDSSFPVTWSPQQRRASFVKFSVYQQDGRYKNGGSKRFVSMISIDFASIVATPDFLFQYCLPIYLTGMAVTSDSLLGWICVGFRFSSGDLKTLELQQQTDSFWRNIMSLDTSIHHALVDVPLRLDLLRPSETILVKDPPTVSHTVHVALGDLSLTPLAQRQLANMGAKKQEQPMLSSDNMTEAVDFQTHQEFIAEIRLSTNFETVSSVSGKYNTTSGVIEWSPADVIIPTHALPNSSVVVEIVLKLLTPSSAQRSSRNFASTAVASTVTSIRYAVCSICVAWTNLSAGKPLNFGLPVRDQEDIRLGNILLSIHSSSLQTSSSSVPRTTLGTFTTDTASSSSFSSQVATLSNSTSKYYLLVEYLEGHISHETGGSALIPSPENNDLGGVVTDNTTSAALYSASDVFFESFLLIHPETQKVGKQNSRLKSRSGYIPSHQIQNWSLSSRILLTPDIAQYLRKVRVWDAVSVGVTVRSSVYPGCPELGKARIALPNQLFQQSNTLLQSPQSRVIEQFVTFYSYENLTHSTSQDAKKHFAGRVRMRISLKSDSYIPLYQTLAESTTSKTNLLAFYRRLAWPNGLGKVMVRLIGVHTSRQPHEDSFDELILFATMTKSGAYSFQHDSAIQSTERIVLQNESFAPQSSSPLNGKSDYHNILSSSLLVGSAEVENSSTILNLDIRTETALSSFTAHFPASKAIPRLIDSASRGKEDMLTVSMPNDHNFANSAMNIPEFIVNLSKKSKPTVLVSASQIVNEHQQQQQFSQHNHFDQKLKLQACFVPYVEGTLLIQVLSPVIAPAIISSTPALQQQIPLLTRISLGKSSFHFADCLIPPIQPQQAQPVVASIRLNTFELLNSSRPGDKTDDESFGRGMVPLLIDIFSDVSVSLASASQIAQSVHTHAEKEPLFTGAVDTAPVYLLALRTLLASASSSTSLPSSSNVANSPPAGATSIPSSRKRPTSVPQKPTVDQPVNNPLPELIWLTTFVDLYKPSAIQSQQKKMIGRLPIRIAFKPEFIPFFIADKIQTLLFPPLPLPTSTINDHGNSNSDDERLRIELGLKQAFIAADSDGSGTISASELLAVIQSGQPEEMKKTIATKSSTQIGLENSSQLLSTIAALGETNGNIFSSTSDYSSRLMRNRKLLTSASTPALTNGNLQYPLSSSASTPVLSNFPLQNTNKGPESTLQMVNEDEGLVLQPNMTDIFQKLDLDGDGTITWCEWKSVLTIALQLKQLQSILQQQQDELQLTTSTEKDQTLAASDGNDNPLDINFLDPIFVLLFACMSILPTSSPLTSYPEEMPLSIDSLSNNDSREGEIEDTFSLMPKQHAADNSVTANFISAPGITTTTVDTPLLPSSKVSSRLNNLVQSLRLTNNLLAQRLESAMTTTTVPTASDTERPSSPQRQPGLEMQEQEKANEQTQLFLRAFRKEHQHANNLRNEVVSLQAEVQQLRQQLPDRQSPARLSTHIEQSVSEVTAMIAERLQHLEARKLQQRRMAEAQDKLGGFLAKYVLPRCHQRREELARKVLCRWLTHFARKSHFDAQLERKRRSVILIQQYYRGHNIRNAYQKKIDMAQKVQRIFRGFQARKQVSSKRLHLHQVLEFRKARAFRVIARVWKLFYKRKQQRAGLCIMNSLKNYHLRMQAKQELEKRRREKQTGSLIMRSIYRIQHTYRQWYYCFLPSSPPFSF